MANTLNNFGLAEKTLNTAGKWCTADIDVKIDSAELENIKEEYLRSGVEVFGVTGAYGKATENVTIPAGIYEFKFDCGEQELNVTGLYYYHNRTDYTRFGYPGSGNTCTLGTFGLGSTIEQPNNALRNSWLDYLVFVPEDTVISKSSADDWYKVMHPYVSCVDKAADVILTPEEIARLIAPCSHTGTELYGDPEIGRAHV